MANTPSPSFEVTGRQLVDCGGLRFEATFRAPAGATLRVLGDVEGQLRAGRLCTNARGGTAPVPPVSP
jgi:hypothetical protein